MTTYTVPNMTCGHCKAKIEDAVLDLDEGATMDFDIDGRTVEIESTAGTNAIATAIKEAGYDAVPKG